MNISVGRRGINFSKLLRAPNASTRLEGGITSGAPLGLKAIDGRSVDVVPPLRRASGWDSS